MKTDRENASFDTASPPIESPSKSSPDWATSARVKALRDRLDGVGPRVVARAPGRLDVLGGFSDGFGASALLRPARECVYVAVRQRADGKIFITDVTSTSAASHEPTVIDSTALLNGTGPCVAGFERNGLFGHDENGVVRGVLGALAEAVRTRLLADFGNGFSFVVHAGGRALAFLARKAAITAGVLRAVTGLVGTSVDAATVDTIAQRVGREWYGQAEGLGDMTSVWLGRAGALTQLGNRTDHVCLPLPPGMECLALHGETQRPNAAEKCCYARTSAEMGHKIIQRIVEAEGGAPAEWDGRLATLGVDPYVERFRDRVPTKIRGREFLAQFGAAVNGTIHIQEETTYKVRSRTEHHIYEQVRCEQFSLLAQRITESPSTELLHTMGELMYGSHWSYGQRCGLGSIGADALVKSIRARGASSGIFGARVSGGGCGGIITVILRDDDLARSILDEVIAHYSARTGNEVMLLRGSTPGAGVDGFRTL